MRAHLSYLSYVLRHKWFVFVAGLSTRAPLWRLLIHDWSKFGFWEWDAYVNSFYNYDGSKKDWKTRTDLEKFRFNRAWNHHQKTNKHHWQYWVLVNDSDNPKYTPLPMPVKYIREMVADWMGAGRAITGKWEFADWYLKNKDKMLIHDDTRNHVEGLIASVQKAFA